MRATFLIAATLLAAPSLAAAAEKSKDPASKVICRTSDVTGSRVLANRICKTKAQWDADAARASDEVLARQQSRMRHPGAGADGGPRP